MKKVCLQIIDYDPFGMVQPGRSFTGGNVYRFGFNGHEKEGTDWTGSDGSHLDFGARIYDSRLGRWLNPDPEKQFKLSQYLSFANNPILLIDPDGGWIPGVTKEGKIYLIAEKGDNKESLIKFFGSKKAMKRFLKPTDYKSTSTKPVIYLNSTNSISKAIADKIENPQKYYDTNKEKDFFGNDKKVGDSYNCHQAAICLSKGESPVDKGNIDEIERNKELGEPICSEDAIVGETIITFGDDHSSTYFGKSKDGTIYTFSKHGDKWSPDIVPIFNVVQSGGSVPTAYGPVREPGTSGASSESVKSENLNSDGTSIDNEQGKGYYAPKK